MAGSVVESGQAGLRRRAGAVGLRGDCAGFSVEVLENASDDSGVFDAGDDTHVAAACFAECDIDVEHALEALRPGHGDVALGWICVAIALFCSPPLSSRRDGGAMGAVGGKHAVVPDEVDARFGDERSQGQSCPDRGWRIVTAKPLSVFG